MPTLDKDWMVTPDGWGPQISLNSAMQILVPLTAPTTIFASTNIDAVGMFQPNDDWTLIAIRGQLNITWDAESAAAPWTALIDLRLIVVEMEEDGTPIVDPSLSLPDEQDANRAFLWHHTLVSRRLGTWLEPGNVENSNVTIDVHVKTRRRVHAGQGIVLVGQNFPVLAATARHEVLPRLRVLGQKMT